MPSPCPLAADVIEIHWDREVALQVQSRSTVTVTAPAPPLDANFWAAEDTFAWHREGAVLEGAATLVDVELPQPIDVTSRPVSTAVRLETRSTAALSNRGANGRATQNTLVLRCTKVAMCSGAGVV